MNRKRYIHTIALTVLAALTAACTADECESHSIHQPIEFGVSQGKLSVTRTTTYGTSATDSKWATTDAVLIADGTTPYTYYPSAVSSSGDGTDYVLLVGSGTNIHFWQQDGETRTIHAWSFGNSIVPSGTIGEDLPTNFTLTNDGENNDLLYATGSFTHHITSPATVPDVIQLDFYHQLAKIIVRVKADATTTISGVTLPGMYVSGAINLLTNESDEIVWNTTSGTADDITAVEESLTSEETADGVVAKYSAVIIPAQYDEDKVVIQVNTDKGNYYFALPEGGFSYYAGKQYVYTLILKNQIDFNVKVTAWTAEESNRELKLE